MPYTENCVAEKFTTTFICVEYFHLQIISKARAFNRMTKYKYRQKKNYLPEEIVEVI